jgi:hypothetical protein
MKNPRLVRGFFLPVVKTWLVSGGGPFASKSDRRTAAPTIDRILSEVKQSSVGAGLLAKVAAQSVCQPKR